VASVLSFLGYDVDPSDIRRWCHTTIVGSDADLAVQGLVEQGIDADLLQCHSVEELEVLLAEGRPPIGALTLGGSRSHAVVVCDIQADAVVVMDPMVGDYVRVSREAFLLDWLPLSGEILLIGGSRLRRRGR
jgi:ABC-type bacteriocin/lantibiotic exporter with double-glycine peptidase domain